jgi:flagellar biosynthesis protein FlhB
MPPRQLPVAEDVDQDQKTESPTAKKRADAEKQGDILQSKELGAAFSMFAGALWLMICGPAIVSASKTILSHGLSIDASDLRDFAPFRAITDLVWLSLFPLSLLFLATIVAAVGSSMGLGSLGFRASAMAFKTSRISPLAGLKRMFGVHGLIELTKAVAKTLLLGGMAYAVLTANLQAIFALSSQSVEAAAAHIGQIILSTIAILVVGFVIIAGIDVPVQFIRRAARLRMTKHEVKQEMRQSDGSPELKQALRRRQFDIAMNSARKAVQEATVVLTNPTHFAVALRYDPARDRAPIVVARGRGETAQAIKALARDRQVPTLEYPQLTRGIYFTSRAGQPIAEDLYIAVATVLGFVFRLEEALASGASQPGVDVPVTKRFDEFGSSQI